MHKDETWPFQQFLSLRVCESRSGGWVGWRGFGGVGECQYVECRPVERKGNSVGSAGLWHADVWLRRTKTLPNPAVWVLTLTESLLLHVRTNGAFRESQCRMREKLFPLPWPFITMIICLKNHSFLMLSWPLSRFISHSHYNWIYPPISTKLDFCSLY